MKKWMKRGAIALLALALVCAAAGGLSRPGAAATAQKEFRGMWVATVYNLDYPSRGTTDPQTLKKQADEILQGCVEMGMTAVILQVRPSCDALYPSEIFPWSKYLTGAQGVAPEGGFDPLEYWVERAHALGLELHAWINPFRVTKGGAQEWNALDADNPAARHHEWVVEHQGNYYLDPGLPEVRELVIQGAEELARNYDIDGIHLDDYFYPGTDFADDASYAKYGQGFASRADWRRDNVNQLIRQLGERLHAIDPSLSYGISPSGVWADKSSMPEGSDTTGGYESYSAAYADSRKWVKEGWIDYICPQIYWYIGHKSMDYATIARWWADTVKGTGVVLYIGMADYQAGNTQADPNWAGTAAIEAQLALNDTLPQVTGEVHFRYQLIAANPQLKQLYVEHYADQPEQTPAPQPVYLAAGTQGYIQGSGGYFRPDDVLTRGEVVTLLARLTVDEAGKALYTGAPYTGGFSDVDAGAWYAPYAAFARGYQVVKGYPDGTFRPEQGVTRAELVKLLSAYQGLEGQGSESAFSDVSDSYWASKEIAWAAGLGLVTGYPDGTFRPDQTVSRAEAVVILNRALGLSANGALENPFADVDASHWAYGDILAAAGAE